jgi:hypothetical protein
MARFLSDVARWGANAAGRARQIAIKRDRLCGCCQRVLAAAKRREPGGEVVERRSQALRVVG